MEKQFISSCINVMEEFQELQIMIIFLLMKYQWWQNGFINFFLVLKRLNPDIKFIISGDYQQLLPVNDRVGDCNYENSSALNELVDGNRLQLTNCRRSDRLIFDMLDPKNIMKLQKEQFGSDTDTELHLSFTNKTRK